MAAEMDVTGDELRPALEDREFSIARKGYDREEVRAFLREIEANLRQLEEWAERTRARLALAEDKSGAIADVDQAMLAAFDAKERVLKRAGLRAERIEAEAKERARIDAEIVAAGMIGEAREVAAHMIGEAREEAAGMIAEGREEAAGMIAEAREEARRIVETALSATTPTTGESILAAARAQADRLIQDARAEADRLVDHARAEAGILGSIEPAGPSEGPGAVASDRSVGSTMVSRLLVEMQGVQVQLEGPSDEGSPAGDGDAGELFAFDPDGNGASRRSRYEHTSAGLPSIGDDASAVHGSMRRLRKKYRNS